VFHAGTELARSVRPGQPPAVRVLCVTCASATRPGWRSSAAIRSVARHPRFPGAQVPCANRPAGNKTLSLRSPHSLPPAGGGLQWGGRRDGVEHACDSRLSPRPAGAQRRGDGGRRRRPNPPATLAARALGGQARGRRPSTRLVEGGAKLKRAAAAFSHVKGVALPAVGDAAFAPPSSPARRSRRWASRSSSIRAIRTCRRCT
jgi:hypothetical protein